MSKIKRLPDGCGYEGHDFGASYPDSQCYGGQLYDLDACDNDGNLYEPPEYLPCPGCNHKEWRERFREQIEMEGYEAAESGKPKAACPYPKDGLKYPKDNPWLKRCWLRGHADFLKEQRKASKQ